MRGWFLRRWLRGKSRCPACGNGMRGYVMSPRTSTTSNATNVTVTWTPQP